MAKGTSSKFKFQYSPAANWLYVVWSTKMLSNGDTEVTATLRMRHTYQLRGTWYFYLTLLGKTHEFSYYINHMSRTVKDHVIGKVTATKRYSQYSKSSPKDIPISCEATINGHHIYNKGNLLLGKASGNVTAKSDLWSVPSVSSTALSNISSTSVRANVKLSANPYNMFRIKLEINKKGSSSSSSVTSDWGTTNYSNTFSGLSPYTTYQVHYTRMEYNNLQSNASKKLLREFTTSDVNPTISSFKTTTVGRTSISVATSTKSNSGVTYEYRLGNGSWISGSSTHTFKGLKQNTTYNISVRVKNQTGNYITKSVSAKTLFTPPDIISVTAVPGTTSAVFTINATSVVGISDYEVLVEGRSFRSTSNVITVIGLEYGTSYSAIVRVYDVTSTSSRQSTVFRTTYPKPVIKSTSVNVINPWSSVIRATVDAPAGVKSLTVSRGSLNQQFNGSVVVTDGTPDTDLTYVVALTSNDDQVADPVNVTVSYPKVPTEVVLPTGVPVRFIRNTSSELDNVPIVDGQVLMNTTSSTLLYDVGNKRVPLGSNVVPIEFSSNKFITTVDHMLSQGSSVLFHRSNTTSSTSTAVLRLNSVDYPIMDSSGASLEAKDVPEVFVGVLVEGKVVIA